MTLQSEIHGQIPLPIKSFERLDFESFQAGKNREILPALNAVINGASDRNIYLWGSKGAGKSHLLQAVCSVSTDHGKTTAYIPLTEAGLTPEILNGLTSLDIVCVDDLDRVSGMLEWEQKIFTMFNEMRDQNKPVIYAASSSPRGLNLTLPDLETRLSWDLVYRLEPISEELLALALQHRARSKMFDLPDDVVEFLIRRVSRDTHTLFSILEQLDKASLQSKRKLSVPFVKELLNL